MAGLVVRHNIEVAHRITTFEGKCNNIHGHSMWVELHLQGEIKNATGLVGGLDFGSIKKTFRAHLDDVYDHHLLLWREDPFFQVLEQHELWTADAMGVTPMSQPPTTENIARQIFSAFAFWPVTKVKVQETHVNGAVYP